MPTIYPGISGELVLGDMFTGDLDDIIIYDRDLTPAEVGMLFRAPACCNIQPPKQKGAQNPTGEVITPTGLRIYPNPATSSVSVSSAANGSAIKSVSIYTSTGQAFGPYNFNAQEVSIDISKVPAGMYFMKITTETQTTTEKLIKE